MPEPATVASCEDYAVWLYKRPSGHGGTVETTPRPHQHGLIVEQDMAVDVPRDRVLRVAEVRRDLRDRDSALHLEARPAVPEVVRMEVRDASRLARAGHNVLHRSGGALEHTPLRHPVIRRGHRGDLVEQISADRYPPAGSRGLAPAYTDPLDGLVDVLPFDRQCLAYSHAGLCERRQEQPPACRNVQDDQLQVLPGWRRLLRCITSISPSASFHTASESITRTASDSRSRSNSSRISPWKSGSLKPTP